MSQEGLTDAQRATLRQNLLAQQQELSRSLRLSHEADQPVDLDEPIGRLSRMEAIQQRHMAAATRQRHQRRLQQTLAALDRLHEAPEDFGFCLSCDEAIAWRRLEARPESTLCLKCQSARESR